MVKHIQKRIFFLMLIMLLINVSQLIAQVRINGPACIISGLTYQYVVSGGPGDKTGMQLCGKGGKLISGENCTSSGSALSSVLIVWNDTSFRKLELTTSSGNTSLTVEGTTELNGGQLHDSDKVRVYDTTNAGYSFRCKEANGGTCSPSYLYQWQKSDNYLHWISIEGATSKDYEFTGTIRVNTYFRRVTTEANSHTVSYSDSGLLVVVFNQ